MCVCKAQRNSHVLVLFCMTDERFLVTFKKEREFLAPFVGVQGYEDLVLSKTIYEIANPRQGVKVLDCHCVNLSVINTRSHTFIFLHREEEGCNPFGDGIFEKPIF